MRRVHDFLDWTHQFKTYWWSQGLLIVLALPSIYWGYTDYYGRQLAAASPWLRPFIADSPNAVGLFALVILLAVFRKRSALLDLFAWVANIKVGIWSAFVLLYYYQAFFDHDAVLRWLLFWLHIGMVAQAMLLHHDLRRDPPKVWMFLVVAAWLVLTDWLDYGPLRIHPYLPDPQYPTVTAIVTVALSIATFALAWIWFRPARLRTLPQ